MTELERFEAAFAALPPEVRATVLVIWLEVMSGRVDLSKLRKVCLESLARADGDCVDAMMLDLVGQLIAHLDPLLAGKEELRFVGRRF